MKCVRHVRFRAVCVVFTLMLMSQTAVWAQAGDASVVTLPRDASQLRQTTVPDSPGRRLASSIAAAANAGLLADGRQAAAAAILECQRGDYPGGGLGLLSMPFGRSGSRTDHCFR